MRQQIIIGNWKMNGSLATIKSLCEGLNKITMQRAEVVVCAPTIYLSYVKANLSQAIKIGAQNVSQYNDGAYTGETSAAMLKDLNCQYVIVGHSERRAIFKETNDDVAAKTKQAVQSGLIAIVCVGESLQERTDGKLKEVLAAQLNAVLYKLSKSEAQAIIIAYEPVWAIGTGLAATAQQVQDVHCYLRQVLTKFDEELAKNIKIIYGGSLKPSNAKEILSLSDVDGGLIGGASLVEKDFDGIVKQAKLIRC